MKKIEALALFPGLLKHEISTVLGMPGTGLKFWPEKLDMVRADRVRGAAMRLGFVIPPHLQHCYYDEKGKRVESEPIGSMDDEDDEGAA